MKFVKYFAILSVSAITLSSCSKFLDTEPTDSLSPEFYYSNEQELNNALTGVYDILGSQSVYGNAMFNQLGAASDESYYARNTQSTGPMVLNYDSSDPDIRDLWKALYTGIQRANLLLENIDKPVMDDAKRKVIEGEAKFLRGYYHFLLVSNWGDVPLVTTTTASVNDTDMPKTSSKDVYAQILKDMEEAEGLVGKIDDLKFGGRVSKSAVQGILARVNLYMAGYPLRDVSRYPEALKWAQKVVDGPHSLNPDYSDIFIKYAQDQYDIKESIWEVEFWGNRIGNAYQESGRVGNTNGIQCNVESEGYSYGFISATPKLYELYDATDKRRDWAIAHFKYVGQTAETLDTVHFKSNEIYQRNAGKFRRKSEVMEKQKNFTPQNFPLLRYADVLLMLAEAENAVHGPTPLAHEKLNEVRARAGIKLFTVVNNNLFTDPDDFQIEIQNERARELCFEALRIPDLKRWGLYLTAVRASAAQINKDAPAGFKYAAAAGTNIADRHLFYPIPLHEMSLNKALIQNKGW